MPALIASAAAYSRIFSRPTSYEVAGHSLPTAALDESIIWMSGYLNGGRGAVEAADERVDHGAIELAARVAAHLGDRLRG